MYLDTLPKDLILLLAVLFWGTVHARSDEKVPVLEGIRSAVASAGIAFVVGWILFTHTPLLTSVVIGIVSLLAFLGTSVQLAIIKFGSRILAHPDQLLRAVLPPFLAKFLPPADDSAQTPK